MCTPRVPILHLQMIIPKHTVENPLTAISLQRSFSSAPCDPGSAT